MKTPPIQRKKLAGKACSCEYFWASPCCLCSLLRLVILVQLLSQDHVQISSCSCVLCSVVRLVALCICLCWNPSVGIFRPFLNSSQQFPSDPQPFHRPFFSTASRSEWYVRQGQKGLLGWRCNAFCFSPLHKDAFWQMFPSSSGHSVTIHHWLFQCFPRSEVKGEKNYIVLYPSLSFSCFSLTG